jgi:hypothetical protein
MPLDLPESFVARKGRRVEEFDVKERGLPQKV